MKMTLPPTANETRAAPRAAGPHATRSPGATAPAAFTVPSARRTRHCPGRARPARAVRTLKNPRHPNQNPKVKAATER